MGTTPDSSYQVLRRKILVTMIILPILPFVTVLAIGYYSYTKSLQEGAHGRMIRLAEGHQRVIQSFLDERRADLRFIAASYDVAELSRPAVLESVFENLQAESEAFIDLGVFDAEGTHIAYQGPHELRGMDYSATEWFRSVIAEGTYVSDVFLGFRNSPHFVIAIRVDAETYPWILRATIDTDHFTRLVERIRIGRTGEAYIVNRNGVLQTRRRSGGELLEQADEVIDWGARGTEVVSSIERDTTGTKFVASVASINDGKWALVVRQEVGDALRDLRITTYVGVLILVVGCTGILLLALSMTNLTIRRIRQADEERARLGQQLIVAGRLAEIGEMSAGVAHEINNPLQIIRSEQALIQTILDELAANGQIADGEDQDDLRSSLDQIRRQVDRCGSITQGLLKFARQSEPVVEHIRLWDFIPEVTKLVRQRATVDGIELSIDVADTSCRVEADPAQLQQVLLNLLNNAFDAVVARHGTSGGRVHVVADANDGIVTVEIRDNGIGIRPEIRDKVFTPFFTTKPVGHGTGLGLSVCFGIVEGMGGSIDIESEENGGTSCVIRLPKAESP